MDIGSQIQQVAVDRAVGGLVMVWIVAAICSGLVASETKKRRFWVWFAFSIVAGPIAWYWLVSRVGIPVPKALAVTCPHCGKTTRSDEKRCLFCKRLLVEEEKDRAAQLGQTAATMVFTARRLFGNARKAADEAARRRAPQAKTAEPPRAKTPER
jgi:hypothetical protein